jgi:dsRNA-specific ribonuclease
MDPSDYFVEAASKPLISSVNYVPSYFPSLVKVKDMDRIVKRVNPMIDNDDKYAVIDLFANIGTSSLFFLTEDRVDLVVSFETDREKREMMKRNIYLYGRNIKEKSVVESTGFSNQSLSFFKGAVVFINLLLADEDFSLLSFLEDYAKDVNLVVVYYDKVDKRKKAIFELDKNTGIDRLYESDRNEGNYVIYGQEFEELLDEFKDNDWGLKQNKDQVDINANSMLNYRPEEEDTKKEELLTLAPKRAVKKEMSTIKREVKETVSWKEFCKTLTPLRGQWTVEIYQSYIRSILQHLVKEEKIPLFLTRENMAVWVEAITHESYDLNSNYERLENYGDSILKYVMRKYLLSRYPNMPPRALTEYTNRFMSKEFQKIFSTDMHLPTYILADHVDVTIHIREDLFESFLGALMEVANTIVPELGVIYAYNFIVLVMSDTHLDKRMILGKPKTQLQQRGAMLDLRISQDDVDVEEDEDVEDEDLQIKKKKKEKTYGGIDERSIKVGDRMLVKIIMKDYLIEYLRRELGAVFHNPLVEKEAATATEASENAWLEALNILEEAGYTDEFAQKKREIKTFKDLPTDLVDKVMKQIKLEGLTHPILKKAKKANVGKNVTYLLVAVDEQGLQRKLGIAKGSDETGVKIMTLKNYLKEG